MRSPCTALFNLDLKFNHPEGQVYSWLKTFLPLRQAVVPVGVRRMFHQEKHSILENHLVILQVVSPPVLMFEHKISLSPERQTGYGCSAVQLFLIVLVISHLVVPVFVPVHQNKVVPQVLFIILQSSHP